MAHLSGVPSHDTVRRALVALTNLGHRGAEGADAHTGDGAGILIQLPDDLFRAEIAGLPPAGRYGVATCFLPRDRERRIVVERLLADTVAGEGQVVVGWRDVPADDSQVGEVARRSAPVIRQLFVGAAGAPGLDQDAFERALYVIRRRAENEGGPDVIVPSFSSRTVVYKGMLSADQLGVFYPDLTDPRCTSALALVHSRFSTNTMPSWELAHPYRMLAHNGEVNTLVGNVNWMRARQSRMASDLFGDDLDKVLPIPRPDRSDSANLDDVLELLTLAGRSVAHAVMMLIPEAYEGRDDLPDELRDFYAFHSCLMEPWDGPAAVSFTDGRVIGSTLDRNGLRPGRWVITDDGWVVVSSEAGALPIDPARVLRKGRLRPGKLFLVDLAAGTVSADGEAELAIAGRRPYGRWYHDGVIGMDRLEWPVTPRSAHPTGHPIPLLARQLAFGYTREDLEVLLPATVDTAKEPGGSMGDDAALAVLSDRQPPLFRYFKQRFAQVTNPAIDPERESIVMSLTIRLGPVGNLLGESPEHARGIVLPHPFLDDDDLARLRATLTAVTVDCTWPLAEGAAGLEPALARICQEAAAAVSGGAGILVLSDRAVGPGRVPVPSLLATAAVHHHLVRQGCLLQAGMVVDSGEPRDVHNLACLIGYGAGAVNPYLLWETVRTFGAEAHQRVLTALTKGLRKIISKMGISTIQSYCGAQIFEAVGLDRDLVDAHFTGTPSRIGGIGMDVLAAEALDRHARAWPPGRPEGDRLPEGGLLAWRRNGERHMWNPTTVTLLQEAVRSGDGRAAFTRYTRAVDDDAARHSTLRGLLRFRRVEHPPALDEIEPATEIVRHFVTGAMSLGSISPAPSRPRRTRPSQWP